MIGFIGLGWMGSNFARRLAEVGHPMMTYDLLPDMNRPYASFWCMLNRKKK